MNLREAILAYELQPYDSVKKPLIETNPAVGILYLFAYPAMTAMITARTGLIIDRAKHLDGETPTDEDLVGLIETFDKIDENSIGHSQSSRNQELRKMRLRHKLGLYQRLLEVEDMTGDYAEAVRMTFNTPEEYLNARREAFQAPSQAIKAKTELQFVFLAAITERRAMLDHILTADWDNFK